jgi:hypothetical protein
VTISLPLDLVLSMAQQTVRQIELTHGDEQRSPGPGLDFVIHTSRTLDVTLPGQIRTYATFDLRPRPRVLTSPKSLEVHIRETLRPGVRAFIGNAGIELTFRNIFRRRPEENVRHMLIWAQEAYEIVGDRLVLGPMDFDLMQDAMFDAPLMRWAAEHHVPLAVFCGYRFLFPEDAFSHIRNVCAQFPLNVWWTDYRYPYEEVSRLIKQTGVEVWTGAGRDQGLAAGVLERAAAFGISGVFTERRFWDNHRTQLALNTNNS